MGKEETLRLVWNKFFDFCVQWCGNYGHMCFTDSCGCSPSLRLIIFLFICSAGSGRCQMYFLQQFSVIYERYSNTAQHMCNRMTLSRNILWLCSTAGAISTQTKKRRRRHTVKLQSGWRVNIRPLVTETNKRLRKCSLSAKELERCSVLVSGPESRANISAPLSCTLHRSLPASVGLLCLPLVLLLLALTFRMRDARRSRAVKAAARSVFFMRSLNYGRPSVALELHWFSSRCWRSL